MQRTSLYRHFDEKGSLLYVGISLSVLSRLLQHMQKSGWAQEIARVEVEHFPSRTDALAAEKIAIVGEAPAFNVAGKIGSEPWVGKGADDFGLTRQQKGARARNKKLTAERRAEIASKASRARWRKHFAGRRRSCKPKISDLRPAD